MSDDADVLVVGAGLAGLAAAAELVEAGRRVVLIDQESEANLGGQAWWSLGGLFLVDSPEQRRLGIRDSRELAWQDWQGTAGFDRPEDRWPRAWAEAYVDFAHGEKRSWLRQMGVRFFPIPGWAERGGGLAGGHGNSVPRFHVIWGSGPGVVEPFERRARAGHAAGLLEFRFRHRVTALLRENGEVRGVAGEVLVPDASARGVRSSREASSHFELRAPAVIVTSGGIGADQERVRRHWPVERLGPPPARMLSGVPDHVDGAMLDVVEAAGANLIHPDRMWHYCEGVENWDPIWSRHGIRVLPGPSSLWLDAEGNRLPLPCLPGFDTLATLEQIVRTGYDYSWFILTQRIIEKEFALSGSEQNPDFTERSVRKLLARLGPGAPGPVEAFKQHGVDFVVESELGALVAGMNRVAGSELLDPDRVRSVVEARDREMDHRFTKDMQVVALRGARKYVGDRLLRVAAPHRLLDRKAGPLIAVRLSIVTRKTLGGIETDLDSRVLRADGEPIPGLWAAGEAAGFGGGGMHGYRSLEGTFLGGCIFSGRTAGRAAVAALAG